MNKWIRSVNQDLIYFFTAIILSGAVLETLLLYRSTTNQLLYSAVFNDRCMSEAGATNNVGYPGR